MGALGRWPSDRLPLSEEQRQKALEALRYSFKDALESLRVDLGLDDLFEHVYVPLACSIMERFVPGEPLVVGINGAQGAGKATLYNLLEVILTEGFGLRVVGFSIDDLYLTRTEREHLARDIHPLMQTRGVPGTHDVQLCLDILNQLRHASDKDVSKIPVFDKSTDERCPPEIWHEWAGPADIIFFEGWCVGAKPEPSKALQKPINQLETEEDSEGVWREYVNHQLEDDYQTLFSQIDMLIMLKVPSMQVVYDWRTAQEQKLKDRADFIYTDHQPNDPLRIMDASEMSRFIAHYERLTRWMLQELPNRADVTLELNVNHKIEHIKLKD